MVNPDKVLEAEEGIRAIATELERMRSAAQTLESAEERSSAVVEAARSIIEISKRLVGELDAHSIASIMEPRFDALNGRADRLSEDVKTGFHDAVPRFEALNERADRLSEDVKTGFHDAVPRFEALNERADRLSEDVKTGFHDAVPRFEALNERTDTLSEDMKTGFSYLNPRLADLELELRRIRKRQIVIATFAIATFIAASGGIAVGVLFG